MCHFLYNFEISYKTHFLTSVRQKIIQLQPYWTLQLQLQTQVSTVSNYCEQALIQYHLDLDLHKLLRLQYLKLCFLKTISNLQTHAEQYLDLIYLLHQRGQEQTLPRNKLVHTAVNINLLLNSQNHISEVNVKSSTGDNVNQSRCDLNDFSKKYYLTRALVMSELKILFPVKFHFINYRIYPFPNW
ncbi:Hypothetical_protein [Hexamita inflata]|uniref:Hypothetical_protein n=1 Tax=Hexamita inflata TaxID=28002 RepID=A0AA86PKW5_9EUKA|nr:Hypothetical protein HINF_LOCUS25072 [Hexamita inflata]